MAYNKWTEDSFPRTYARIHLVPDEQGLERDGYTVERFYEVMDSFVRRHLAGRILILQPGVYCAKIIGGVSGIREDFHALKVVLQKNEVVAKYAANSTWSSPGAGTCPLVRKR